MKIFRSLALAALLCGGAPSLQGAVSAVDPADPATEWLSSAQALRSNDLKGWLLAQPADVQARMNADWDAARKENADDTELSAGLASLLSPEGVNTLVAEALPGLAAMDLQQAQMMLGMLGATLPTLAAGQNGAAPDPDLQAYLTCAAGLVQGVSRWLPQAGLKDEARLRQALGLLAGGVKASGITSSSDLFALPLPELLVKAGPMLAEVKKALAVYDLQADAFFASIKVLKNEGSGDTRRLTVGFAAFGQEYQLPIELQKTAEGWEPSEVFAAKFQPLVEQIIGMFMMGSSGQPAPTPYAP